MTILDRYIARQYLLNIGLLFLFLFAVVLVADFSLQFDEYAEIAEKLVDKGASWAAFRKFLLSVVLMWDLWWPRLFLLFNYLLGLILVGAAGFTCTQMVRHREFVAMLAGGLSLYRVARPLLVVAAAMMLVQAANREFLIPRLAPLLTRDKNTAGQRGMGLTRQPLCADAGGRLFYAKAVDLDRQTINGLWVWERSPEGLMTRRISADAAWWQNGRWILTNGRAERWGEDGRVIIEPVQHLESDLDPIALRLRRFEGYSNNLSTRQVNELLGKLRDAAQPPELRIEALERNRAGRLAGMFSNILALMVCLPFFLRREPANMLRQSLKCAPVAIIAVMGAQLGAAAAIPGLPPAVGAFIPVMILIPLAIAAMTSVRT